MEQTIAAWLPPGIAAGVAVALVAASFATSFLTAAFGIGGGALMLGVLASLVPPAALIPVHGLVQLGSNLGRAGLMVRAVAWRHTGGFVAGSLVGAAAGAVVAVRIPPAAVQVGVGLFIAWSVLADPPAWLRRRALLTGALTTFLTMFFGATGPFVAVFVKGLGLGRHAHVATHAALMSVQHLLKTLAFGFLGFAFGAWAGMVAAMIAAGVAGTWAGRRVLDRLGDARFRRALDALLLVIAARLVWTGLAAP